MYHGRNDGVENLNYCKRKQRQRRLKTQKHERRALPCKPSTHVRVTLEERKPLTLYKMRRATYHRPKRRKLLSGSRWACRRKLVTEKKLLCKRKEGRNKSCRVR